MRIAIDIQHAGKRSAPKDRGAPGQVPGLPHEVWSTRRYALALAEHLEADGHEVFVISDGEYRERHARVNELRPDLYLACHANAGIGGRGDRGEIYHWPGSSKGTAAAQAIAAALDAVVPWKSKAVPATTDRTRATVAGVSAPAVLLEPGFLDGAVGRTWLRDEVEAIGQAIGRGVVAWGGR